MGYLTTITIHNDGLDNIRKYPEQFVEGVLRQCSSHEPKDFGVGNFVNMIEGQKTRHADDHTIFVHMGNCVTEINGYSESAEQLLAKTPEFFDRILTYLDNQVKALKRMKKDAESNSGK